MDWKKGLAITLLYICTELINLICRVKRGSEENKFLLRRVKQLQKQNGRLMEQMSKLQALIFNSGTSKATPTTCLMIVLFSALLVSLPNLNISNNKELGDQQQSASLRRSLLFSQQGKYGIISKRFLTQYFKIHKLLQLQMKKMH